MVTPIFSNNPDIFTNLQPGDHMCCIYETDEEHRAVITPYVQQGLERGEKVIYIVDFNTAETVLGYLRVQGLDVDGYVAREQLVMADREDTYLRNGVFDPDAMISFLRNALEQALAQGYKALRVTGEMTWALRGLPGSERLIEYEAKLNHFFPGSLCTAICQYDRKRFDPAILLDVIHTHPVVIIGTQKNDNFYFVPPDVFLGNRPAARLEQWILSLQNSTQTQAAIQKSEAFLKQTQEITRAGGWEFDVLTQKVFWTDEVYRIYEVDRNIDLNDIRNAIRYYAPSDQAKIDLAFQRAVELGEAYDLELRFVGARGTQKWVRTSGKAERRAGKITRVFGHIMDITESRHAQEALQASEERFRTSQEMSLDAFTILSAVRDAKNTIVDFEWNYVNAAAAKILRKPSEELIGKRLLEILPGNLQNGALFERYVQIVEGAQGNEIELEYNADGIVGWFRNMAVKLGDGVVVSFSDITRRKLIEEDREQFFKFFLISGDIMVIIDPSGAFRKVNPATLEVLGYTEAELLSRPFIDFVHPDDQESTACEMEKQIQLGSTLNFENRYLGKDGTPRLLSWKATYDPAEGFTYATARDVTELKQAVAQLHYASAYNRSLLEASLDPLVTIGADGTITDVNVATEQVTGYTRAELIGTDFSAYFTNPDLARAGYLKVFREGTVRDYALEIRHRDGYLTSVLYNAAVYRNITGEVLGVFAAARDITVRKQIEAAEREQRALAEALRDTAAALNSTLKFEDVLDRILNNVGRIMSHNNDAIFILLLDDTQENIRVARYSSTRGLDNTTEILNIQLPVVQIPGLREVQMTGSAVIVPDTSQEGIWTAASPIPWVQSILSVPIKSREKIIGFLSLASMASNAFFSPDADRLLAFANQAAMAVENSQLYEEVQNLAINDALTGLLNRRGLFQAGEREIDQAIRFRHSLAAVMIDIDHFKQVNDTYGHAIGDRVLQALAKCCRAQVRNVDIVARYGGEEFVLLLPEIGEESAVQVAERVRKQVEKMTVSTALDETNLSSTVQVTVSLGVALLMPDHARLSALLEYADQALYLAKQTGRNRVVVGE